MILVNYNDVCELLFFCLLYNTLHGNIFSRVYFRIWQTFFEFKTQFPRFLNIQNYKLCLMTTRTTRAFGEVVIKIFGTVVPSK